MITNTRFIPPARFVDRDQVIAIILWWLLALNQLKDQSLKISPRRAAPIVGIAFILSVIIMSWVDDFLLGNFIIPGDTETLARDIQNNPAIFAKAATGYLIVLVLDVTIGLALYVVLKPASRQRALLTGSLRVLYAGVVAIGVLALTFQFIDVYRYAA